MEFIHREQRIGQAGNRHNWNYVIKIDPLELSLMKLACKVTIKTANNDGAARLHHALLYSLQVLEHKANKKRLDKQPFNINH